MLKLTDIRKVYKVASGDVHALKGVSLEFRENEFVCILGASGCGKTTLLNIIGGLDHYTSGDLIIQGRSTKDYKDRDWDVYRNHRIGFIFQTYNLIPHQTALGNVELALTIAGVGKEERKKRAAQALERVGLGNELDKKPNQLSGGQMQRVAIARALVNNPDILLADEPTGALDSATSVQIMDLIKEIAGERLVIMVTHNPELAYQYATRIVRLKDGVVESDSMPYDSAAEEAAPQGPEEPVREDFAEEAPAGQEAGREDFAEEISAGPEMAQDDAGGDAPQSTVPPVMSEFPAQPAGKRGKKARKPKPPRARMSFLTSLALSAKNLLTKKGRTILTSVAGSIGIVSVSLVLALSSGFNNYVRKTEEDMLSYYPVTVTESAFDLASIMTSFTSPQDMPDLDQLDNKVYVDSFLTSLGEGMTIRNYITQDYLTYLEKADSSWWSAIQYGYGISVVNNLFTGVKTADTDGDGELDETFRSLSNLKEYYINVVRTNPDTKDYANLVGFADYFGDVVNVMPGTLDYGEQTFGSNVSSQYDVIAGNFPQSVNDIVLVVGSNNEVSDLTLAQLGLLDEEKFVALFKAGEDGTEGISESSLVDFSEILGKKYILLQNDEIYESTTYTGEDDGYEYTLADAMSGNYAFTYNGGELSKDEFDSVTQEQGIILNVSGILRLKDGLTYGCLTSGINFTEGLVQEYLAQNISSLIVKWMEEESVFTVESWMAANNPALSSYVGQTFYLSPSENLNSDYFSSVSSIHCTYDLETVVRALGGDDTVTSISIYATNFEGKENLLAYLDAWNDSHEEGEQITYSDTVGMLMSMVQQILDIITYVLVAFTSISLVVSSVMIGIITYVSVVERVKEIGVLRSLGARKQDVRNLFNAETFIIGLAAGLIGIGLAYFISIFINIAIKSLTGIAGIAALPFTTALIMVLVSVVLTLISGLIPAQSAAKKDPVIALRTE